jgi:hypothetical protein
MGVMLWFMTPLIVRYEMRVPEAPTALPQPYLENERYWTQRFVWGHSTLDQDGLRQRGPEPNGRLALHDMSLCHESMFPPEQSLMVRREYDRADPFATGGGASVPLRMRSDSTWQLSRWTLETAMSARGRDAHDRWLQKWLGFFHRAR